MYTVLLVEDEEAIVRVLARSLQYDGYAVVTAANGQEGLDVFRQERPDIVLTDIKMPVMDGLKLLKKIKAESPETEVIIITGHGDMDSSIEALQHDASDFINKPVIDEALSIALKRAEGKIEIRKQLEEYTTKLEEKVEEATREIQRKSSFQSKLIKSSNDGIVATNEDLKVVIFNPEAERIFGYTREEIVSRKTLADVLPRDIAVSIQEGMEQNAFKDLPWREASIRSKQTEEVPVRFSGSILFEQDTVVGSVSFFQDLREIKKLEQELIRSERLAAIGQTVAGLAHGIKNILHGFKGGRYLLESGLHKNDMDKLQEGWQMVKRNIDRTSDLVLDLLSYSKEREPEYTTCSPNAIVTDVCDLFSEIARENAVEIHKDLDASIEEVSLDPHTLHRALSNLLSNALDACLTQDGGVENPRITLRTRAEPGNRLRVDVIDNGCGMDRDIQETLFTSFFSTKGAKGTGLGLLVTRKLIEEHDGSISVDSAPGQGSRFSIRLPYRIYN